MNVNRIIFILLILSFSGNIYLLSKKSKLVVAKTIVKDSVVQKAAAVQQIKISKTENVLTSVKPEPNNSREVKPVAQNDLISTSKFEFNVNELDDTKRAWKKNLNRFLVDELQYGDEVLNMYESIISAREAELGQYINEKIGGNDTFIMTIEDMVQEGRINEKYLNRLKDLLGADYQNYRRYRNEYNQKMLEDEKSFFVIEL